MTDEIRGKTAIITGASRGIGEATAIHLAQCGANIVLCARNGSAMRAIEQQIVDNGGNAMSLETDVSDYQQVEMAVQKTLTHFGGIDILVNNAGVIEPVSRLAESEPDQWSQVVDINLKGVYYGLRTVIPTMLENGGGTIINISSGAATSALEGWSHYCATKAAVLSLTKCVDKEYREQGIIVIGLSPGTVATEMQVIIKDSGINPVSQLDPSVHIPTSDVAQAIAWLCTEEAKDLAGTDFSLRGEESRARVGLG
ncbi:MAG: SDR family oxidoreductase [Acidiferrobacterales bacterium]|nr:SDR family oxidoreductase [Acidiferrobacterales bacterium]